MHQEFQSLFFHHSSNYLISQKWQPPASKQTSHLLKIFLAIWQGKSWNVCDFFVYLSVFAENLDCSHKLSISMSSKDIKSTDSYLEIYEAIIPQNMTSELIKCSGRNSLFFSKKKRLKILCTHCAPASELKAMQRNFIKGTGTFITSRSVIVATYIHT